MAIATEPVEAPRISISGAGKAYGGTWVLQDVSLEIEPGEIHALLGENGAGKSTLLKILAGAISADAGTLSLGGRPATLGTPRRAIDAGISLISQELALVPDRSVIENVFLGSWSNRLGVVVGKDDRQLFEDLLERTGFDLDPDALVRTLPIGKAQQVEVIRALARGSAVLCLDEPTAVLGEADTEKLLAILRQLASEGTTIILVSHFLDEVLSFADRLTVLRDGRHVATGDAADHTPDSLIKLMVGRQVEALTQEPPEIPEDAPVVLEARGLNNDRIHDISLEVRKGEILGLVGLVGSGRSETLNAIFGSDQRASGTVTVDGAEVARNSVRHAMRRGIALVPEARKDQGLVLGRSGLENIALPTLNLRQLLSFIRRGEERKKVQEVAEQTDIRGNVHGAPVGLLSGGNQQKTLFAKWLVHPPRVLLVDEPTRGVDIAAKAKLHKLIIDLAANGTAVIVASSDLEELFALSHRMCVLKRGRIAGVYGRSATRDEIMSAAFI